MYFPIQNALPRGKKQALQTDGFSFAISCSDHGRIMLESSAIVNDASTVFGKFLIDFGVQFFVAGAVFGGVEGWVLLLRAL